MPDPATLIALGLLGLFVAAFLAGSVLPFPSEVVLVALLEAGATPTAVVAVATLGNVAGAVTLYALGLGIAAGKQRWWRPRPDEDAEPERGRRWLQRWGAGALLLSWVPVAGDALVLGAGLAGLGWAPFLCLVTVGKLGRYLTVTLLSLQILG